MAEQNPAMENLAIAGGELNGKITFEFTPQALNRWHKVTFLYSYQGVFYVSYSKKLGKTTTLDRVKIELELPIKEREYIYGNVTGQNGILLRTNFHAYSDANYQEMVDSSGSGSSVWASFPHREVGPEAELWVGPVSDLESPLSQLYIPNKTKVSAELPKATWAGKYGAKVVTATVSVGTQSGESPFVSDYITGANAFYVKGTVTDTRGISTTYQQLITPTVASIPQLLPCKGEISVIVARWKVDKENPNGVFASDGDQMYIAVRRNFSKLIVNGEQGNFCTVSFKAKAMGESTESEWVTILDEKDESDEQRIVITDVGGRSFDVTKTFTIQLRAQDKLGNENISTFKLPTEAIYMCKAGAMNSIAFGGYVSQPDSFEVYWQSVLHGGLILKSESGDSYFRITVDDNGVLTASPVSEAQTFLLRRGNK